MININISGLIFTTADEQIVQIDVNLDVVKAIIAISEVSLVVFFFFYMSFYITGEPTSGFSKRQMFIKTVPNSAIFRLTTDN